VTLEVRIVAVVVALLCGPGIAILALRWARTLLHSTAAIYTVALVVLSQLSGVNPFLLVVVPLSILCVVIVVVDLLEQRIPNRALIWGYPVVLLTLAAVTLLSGDAGALLRAVVSGVAYLGLYFSLALIRPTGMGMGDVKFSGMLGIALGYVSLNVALVGLVAGFVFGAIFGLGVLSLRKNAPKTAMIPFAPAMACGAFVAICTNLVSF
jgi:leader peptidase (prepilin peptidase)/N-methyltransferase